MENNSKSPEQLMINSMNADSESVQILADYLGYDIGNDPVDPSSDVRILFSKKTDDKSKGVIATTLVDNLTPDSKTIEIRRLYEQVIELKSHFGLDISVSVIAFVGKKRIVFFPTLGGNRDTRLDVSPQTIDIPLYKVNLSYLKDKNIKIEEDIFGDGVDIRIDDNAFRKELSSHFLTVVSLYRKKLSEWITASDLKNEMVKLVSDEARKEIENNDIKRLVQENSYKSVLSTVVDTITLRQLMRRFLEGYYGADSFNVDDIALGVGDGTLDEAIAKAANIAKEIGEEKQIKKINKQHTSIGQLDLFNASFTPEEQEATSKVEIKDGEDEYLSNLSQKALKQFKLAYGGDLFAGSIGDVATRIENELAKQNKVDWVKLYADTKAGNYSFRFEDMPPEAVEKQYEDSMSKNVQINLDKETNEPVVFYGDDEIEQKNKGAYYTDQRFVNYMVEKTVAVEFQRRYRAIKEAIKSNDIKAIQKTFDFLLDLKIADFSCGGGSFLRGAFLKIADQFHLINELNIPDELKKKYPFFSPDADAQYEWESYVLKHMIYGVDIDYKAIIISSLTLTLSSLQHRPKSTKLPELIGRTLIHQNSLINAVPYYKRKEVFSKYQKEIAQLVNLKGKDFTEFVKLRDSLQAKVIPEAGKVSEFASMLEIQAIELNLPEVYFNQDGTLKEHGGMDIVIGNPPWEIWKPNSDEFFSEYDETYRRLPNKTEKKKLEKILFEKFPEIEQKWKTEKNMMKAGSSYYRDKDNFHYQSWTVDGRKTSSDLNLYKVSLERFIQLAKNDAIFDILVPDNFATDNGSTGLRHLVMDNYNLKEFLSFENRKGIFQSVDNRYKFASLLFNGKKESEEDDFKAFFYRRDLEDLNNDALKLKYPLSFLKSAEPERYAMVESRNQNIFDLYKKIRLSYPILGETSLLKLGNDFHKTNDSDKFIDLDDNNKESLIPLFEGKYMNQFTIIPSKVLYGVKKDEVENKVGEIYKEYRIGLRSVGRATDLRSLIATLLPPNFSSTNSLLTEKNTMSIQEKLFTLGLLNSYVLDFVLRNLISMNINQIYLKQLPIPRLSDIEDSKNIILIVKELLKENQGFYEDLDEQAPGNEYIGKEHDELVAELNARVAIDFKLTRTELVLLMHTFESANHKKDVEDETQRILDKFDELNK